MFLDQKFPVSIEAQFLGGSGVKDRPTLNMCSPGTEVDINGSQAIKHCVFSNSKTYHNEDWISVEFIVYSDSIVHHVIDRDTVMTYSNIKIGLVSTVFDSFNYRESCDGSLYDSECL